MKVLWALLCQSVVVDKTTNNVSLFNVIEEVSIPILSKSPTTMTEIPLDAVPALFNFVILFARTDPEVAEVGRARIKTSGPGATSNTSQEFEVDLTQFRRSRSILRVPGLPVAAEGDMIFQIEGKDERSNWGEQFRLPIRVAQRA
jgi:hypothetical protein